MNPQHRIKNLTKMPIMKKATTTRQLQNITVQVSKVTQNMDTENMGTESMLTKVIDARMCSWRFQASQRCQ